jgi:hypothetical protein
MDIAEEEENYRRQLKSRWAHVGLSDEQKMEEEIYHSLLRQKWGRHIGDPLLKSITKEGTPVKGIFGKTVNGDKEMK